MKGNNSLNHVDIGNNVAIGTGSQVWTHISFGDTFSGCRLRTSHGVTLADEAWLAGPVIIQAASLAPRVVVLAGSNVVHDIDEPNTIWTGNPPVNVTGAMGGPPWTTITVEQKLKRFNRLLRAYETETGERFSDRFSCVVRLPPKVERRPGVTYFEADNRIYTKLGTDAERRFMRWLLKLNKAKFTPEP